MRSSNEISLNKASKFKKNVSYLGTSKFNSSVKEEERHKNTSTSSAPVKPEKDKIKHVRDDSDHMLFYMDPFDMDPSGNQLNFEKLTLHTVDTLDTQKVQEKKKENIFTNKTNKIQ